MAITIYENHLPPNIEHLVWGGGYGIRNSRNYAISNGQYKTHDNGGGGINIICWNSNFVYLMLYTLNNISSLHGLYRGYTTGSGDRYYDTPIVEWSIEEDTVPANNIINSDDREYLESVLPSAWLNRIQHQYSDRSWYEITFKLPLN